MNQKILRISSLILFSTLFMAVSWTYSAESGFRGKVAERMESGGYVYLNLDVDGEMHWVATQSTQAEVGDLVDVPPSMEMKDFMSKSLDRIFPSIYFASAVTSGRDGDSSSQPAGLPAGHPSIPSMTTPVTGGHGMMGSPHSGETDQKPLEEVIQSLKKQEGCQTIAELFASKDSLKGKAVKVQAVVVKYSPNILGTNWVRVKDGTGAQGTDTLMVTTSQVASPGNIVMVEGVIDYDHNLGSGYVYPAIIKDADVTISASKE